ncbi:MAG: chromate efflux transporter [Gammaproteobacteria bacterium]|nr:chromate efflux transporter [Gammaproteobacteria bacterium]
MEASEQSSKPVSLWFLFKTFLAIGSVAFGGFMALISVIENRIVKRHALLEHKEMLDGISLANLLPGPQAVNVVAFIGYRLRGPLGALVCAVAVLVPTFLMVWALSYLYFKYGEIAQVQKVFQGFIPAVSAIVLSVAWRMGKKTVKGGVDLALVSVAFALLLLVPLQYKLYTTLAIVAGFGVIGYGLFRGRPIAQAIHTAAQRPFSKLRFAIVMVSLLALVVSWFLPLPLDHHSLLFMTLTFASMSLILFGGGYVFIPIIGSVVVLQMGWVTQQQFTDGIAMGQITPGPILISAAFIGFKLHGFWGALLATIAIFTPPATLMVTTSHALGYIQNSRVMRAAMHGIHCGVIGMIIVAALILLKSGFPAWPFGLREAWPSAVILLASLYALLRHNLDVLWIVLGAGALGYLLY